MNTLMYRLSYWNSYRHYLRGSAAKGRGLREVGVVIRIVLLNRLTYRYYARGDLVLLQHVVKFLVNLTIVILSTWSQQKLHREKIIITNFYSYNY